MKTEKIRSFKTGVVDSAQFVNVKIDANEGKVDVYIRTNKGRSTMIMCYHAEVYFNSYESTGDSDYEIECYDREDRLIALASSDFIRGE